MIIIIDKGGDSIENAIVILGADSNYEGVSVEHYYFNKLLTQYIAPFDWWLLKQQSLLHIKNKYYDEFIVQIDNQEIKKLYFDITDFYGKKPEILHEIIEKENEIKNNLSLSKEQKSILLKQLKKIKKEIIIIKGDLIEIFEEYLKKYGSYHKAIKKMKENKIFLKEKNKWKNALKKFINSI